MSDLIVAEARLAAEEIEPPADLAELVVFRLGSQRYAIAAVDVLEVIPLSQITALPGGPAFYLGFVSHRGIIYPLIDIRSLVGGTPDEIASPSHAILFRSEAYAVALVADAVEFIQIDTTTVANAPPRDDLEAAPAICGVTADAIVVLDVRVLLADARLVLDDRSFSG
jgi:purine-binding chemotaxis protein CheW